MSSVIDLHIHSLYSDGTYSISDIVDRIQNKQMKAVSICDHDTLKAYEKLPEKIGHCAVIKGIEISAQDHGVPIHILGYHIKVNGAIEALCRKNLLRRNEISLWQIMQLQKHGYNLSVNEVSKKAQHASAIYKQHIMDVMMDHKYTSAIYSPLYQQLFKHNGICMKPMEYVEVKEAIQAIHQDGGLAFLAHPFLSNVEKDIPYYINLGIDGLETWHSSHSAAQCTYLHDIAKQYNLLESGGSDTHGYYGNEPALGESNAEIMESEVMKWLMK